MRRFFKLFRELSVLLSVTACVAAVVFLFAAPVFAVGESYTLYLGASSSSLQAETDSPVLDKIRFDDIAGESTLYSGDRYEELKARFHATLLFTEEACGVTNYYLYSDELGGGVYLNGECVNLHVAVSGGRTAVGTPLIFGGY